MKKFSSRDTLILVVNLCLVIVFSIYYFVVRPMRDDAADINDRLRLDQSKLVKAHQMIDKKILVESRYQNLMRLVGVADSEEAQMPAIVSKIDAAARESNIHIANIQPQKTVNEKEVRFLSVELEIDGQWLDIVKFLYTLQQQPNLYFINELNLEKYSDTTNSLRGRIVVSRMCLVNF